MKKLNKKAFTVIEAVIIIATVAVLAAAAFVVVKRHSQTTKLAPTDIKQFVQADFIDLSKIMTISKFRSAEGHDFSGGGETCRSMKHYFYPQQDADTAQMTKNNNGMPPGPDGKTDINIFSPVDGVIEQIASERFPVGEQFYIKPDSAKNFTIRLFHVYKIDGITKGSHLKAGQKIGVISKASATDISVEYGSGNYVSYFSVMPDSIFAAYKTRGVNSRDDLIISKEYRDAHPVPCSQGNQSDQAFHYPAGYDHEADDVHLSGYTPFDQSSMIQKTPTNN